MIDPLTFSDLEMTVEKMSVGPVVDQLKYLLDSLPVSRAAIKKKENETIASGDANTVMPNVKEANFKGDNDKNLIIDSNDTLLEENACVDSFETDQKVPVVKPSRILCPTSPVSLLLELSQSRDAPNVIWEEFSKNGRFGCKVYFGDKFWIVPAEYSRKKEARTMVALMACTELIGDNILFENIELVKYESWTKNSVRKLSDDLAENNDHCKESSVVISNDMMSNNTQNTETANFSFSSSDKSVSYVSLVNEACQKCKIDSPVYNISEENSGATLKYRCFVENIFGFPSIQSEPLSSKRAAKNDVAKQIYEHMQINGKIDDIPKRSINLLKNESSNEIISVIKNLFNSSTETPLDLVALIPLVMTLLTHVSQSCYPEKSTIEGIYEMIDQWRVFLEWKNQKAKF